MKFKNFSLTIFFGFIASALLFSQSIVDVAKNEKERREKVKEKSRVITNEILKRESKREINIIQNIYQNLEIYGIKEEETKKVQENQSEKKDEAYWRNLKKELEEKYRKAQEYADLLQTKLNSLWMDFYALDDPYQREQVQFRIQETTEKLEKAKDDLAKAKKELDELPEKARKAGALPGWIR